MISWPLALFASIWPICPGLLPFFIKHDLAHRLGPSSSAASFSFALNWIFFYILYLSLHCTTCTPSIHYHASLTIVWESTYTILLKILSLPKLLSLFLSFWIVLVPIYFFTVLLIIFCPFHYHPATALILLSHDVSSIHPIYYHVDYSLFLFPYWFTMRPRLATLSLSFLPCSISVFFGCGSSFFFLSFFCGITFFLLSLPFPSSKAHWTSRRVRLCSRTPIVALSPLRNLPLLRRLQHRTSPTNPTTRPTVMRSAACSTLLLFAGFLRLWYVTFHGILLVHFFNCTAYTFD